MNKKKLAINLGLVIIALNFLIIILGDEIVKSETKLQFQLEANKNISFEVFFAEGKDIDPSQSTIDEYLLEQVVNNMDFTIAENTNYIRFDFGGDPSELYLSDIKIICGDQSIKIEPTYLIENQKANNMLNTLDIDDGKLHVITNGEDPYLLVDMSSLNIYDWVSEISSQKLLIEKIIICCLLDVAIIGLLIFSTKLFILPIELYRNRKLILKLAKNDFKTKYAGSYFGVFWAFVQPVITILLYWFVFQVGFRSSSVGDYPFVLWLIAGLVPWFYFSDAINYGTNSLIEYSYLVKKVVFNISIIPIVKIVSAFFVHIFFLGCMFLISWLLGYPPDFYSLQILYYTLCISILTIAITYSTSAIILFFRDLGQIINILLQIGVWMTPIMWNINMVPQSLQWIFKLNPMYYIVRGYRDALLDKVWFVDRIGETVLFWGIVGALIVIGILVFKKLKPHFADVL